MKYLNIFSLIALSLAIGCGSDSTSSTTGGASNACASTPFLGQWTDTTFGDILTLNADCTGTLPRCAATLNFKNPNSNGTIDITFTASNAAAFCPNVGTYSCAYNNLVATTLTIDCGSGALTYTK
ncbi:hypothetical protein E6Q11_02430 [Candidatus Dojkabacteria bacterium]|uniref:Ig-like domain-containing protein n=1 Tax=Candidatus Dojkabacteria bacterium TaxID=2099670 RepID=A0A5C7J7Q3_9BACT|nr:MAG: hypothetical protein E6Q11_02430 [Candidatus Dojkabacteria bacterium]